jgi:hypothetical protein
MLINQKYLEQKSSLERLKIENNDLNENIIFSENKIKDQEKIIKELQSELKKLKLSNRTYEQFMADNELKLNLSKNLNTSFIVNNKINDEANNIKTKYEKDIIKIKKDYEDVIKSKEKDFEIEITNYKNKISNYEFKLKEKQNSLDLFKSHIDINNNKLTEEINLLKIELDNKKQEIESKNSILKEQIASLEVYQKENEKLN